MKTRNWTEFKKSHNVFTGAEQSEIDFMTALVSEMVERRQTLGITQDQLEKKSGIRQGAISRIERHGHSPNLTTLLRLLEPLGLTLKITDL